ncbi:MAG TPA: energy transducer TonB [Candidatus Eisenbacteria bacterium]|nr:energy transducer TonB [Candidatus Eisenbacteria bacterium]
MYMRRITFALLALSYSLGPATWAQGQQSNNDAARKVVRRIQPEYPADARRMNLGGVVKLVAMVAPNGSVKKVEPVGGSPLLVRAAESAVSQWKYEAGTESKETIEIHFTP